MNNSNHLNNDNMFETMYVIKRTGEREEVSFDKCLKRIQKLSKDLKINPVEVAKLIITQIYDGVETMKLDELAAEICAAKTTIHPDYAKLASRIIISNHHKNTSPSYSEVIQQLYNNKDDLGLPKPLINERLYKIVTENKEKINSFIDYEKDYNYDYFGFKTLERAYLKRVNGKIVERPQHMLMRVSLAIHKDDLKEALKSYKLMSEGYFTHATPTLFNMGTLTEQASSCFLMTIDDDSIDGIYKTLSDCAKISKYAGGIGIAIHKIRAKHSTIRGHIKAGTGIVPMLKVFNETARYVNQTNLRPGSFAHYLEPWHADIEDFLKLRLNTGIEEERARDLFYAVWVPDLFMRRVEADADWTLMSPDKCPDLYLKYGREFEELYVKYENEKRGNKTVKARFIWELILQAQIETGMPYIGYKDAINEKNNQKNLGTIQSSNLCHEICEFTSRDEIAVCNLASIALPRFVEPVRDKDNNIISGKMEFNYEKLREITKQVVKNLNKVIDYNYYPVKEAETSNRRHRPIGTGVSGLSDCFAMLKIAFDSEEAQKINRLIFENMYFAAVEASMELARKRKKYVQEYKRLVKLGSSGNGEITEEDKKRMQELKTNYFIIDEELKLPNQFAGCYSSFVGSPISEGKLQYDLWGVEPSEHMKEEWVTLKGDIAKHGVRNSLLIALMPTASTSQIMGWNECFEPFTNNIYTRKTLAGTFVVVNKYLMNELIELGLWTPQMKDKIIMADGSVQNITEIPDDVKSRFKTVWEIKQKVIIDLAISRGGFICQTQSLNCFVKAPTFKILNSMHFYNWKLGAKTGIYYLRSQAKTQAQKFSVDLEKIKNDKNPILTIDKTNITTTENNNTNTITDANSANEKSECLMCSA